MEKSSAIRIIKNTFEKSFDKEQYRRFIKELFNHLDESNNFFWAGNRIPNAGAFQPFINSIERVGKYQDADGKKIDCLIVNLKKETTLEHARTRQRNFVARYLQGHMGGDDKDAALVAFVSPDSEDWRFSLVKVDYSLDLGKLQTELTPARRYSFLVGKNESSHTAQLQLLSILQDDKRNPLLADFEKAFNIEVVTKEFFTKYRELFHDVEEALEGVIKQNQKAREDFEANGVDNVNFAKKLLGQIVFLYFLQKKGWFGVGRDDSWGTGPKDFLRGLFEKKIVPYQNFFNDILEPLFYHTLAIERTDDFSDRFNCKIPFLNGGLFDPINNYDWIHTDILIPNKLFSNEKETNEGDTGTGILDVFDRYNFTVKEDEPLDKEVAVDPEMLGKVFENLLEVKDRKSKGTYYTPREIVHYMCRESLINYLDTTVNNGAVPLAEEKPVNLKLLGAPATQQMAMKTEGHTGRVPRVDIETFVRTGELAVEHDARVESTGKETRDYSYKLPASIRLNAKLIDDALADIRVCDPAIGSGAFPVGMMSEIVRARNVLKTWTKTSESFYDFKRHAIQNCLYGVDIDPSAVEIAKLRLWLSLVVDEEDIKQIQPLPNLDYKIVCGNSLLGVKKDIMNWPLFDELEKLKPLFFAETNVRKKKEYKEQIDLMIQKITNNDKNFNFEVYFSEVLRKKGGFDVIIANPPYVRQENIKELKPGLQKHFSCYTGVADLYVYFYERGFQLLRDGGVLTFISSNKYFRSGYGEKLRQFLASKSTMHQLIDFGDAPVFEAIAYPSIIVLSKRSPGSNQTRALNWEPGPPIEAFDSVFQSRSFLIAQKELTADGWRLESHAVLRLLEKLSKEGKPLDEYVNGRFYRGILTGLNEAFVVDRATHDRLIAEHPSSAEVLNPFLRGKDVKRWTVDFGEQYLIKIESSENKKHPWSGKSETEAEKAFAKTYPAIHKRFGEYRKELVKRQDQGTYFWELRSCKYWQEFESPKIIYPNICKRNEFAWEGNSYYANQKTFIIPNGSKYLMAVLNSSVVMFLFANRLAKLQNGFYEPSAIFIKDFPIPKASDVKPIETLVDRILAAKAADPAADVSALEQEIDQLVYKLYGLTPEEIAVVEGNSSE